MNKVFRRLTVISLLTLQLWTVGFCQVDVSSSTVTGLSDIDGHWSKSYIEELSGRGIVKGYPDGTFKPEGNVTVAEFTKMLMTSSDIPLGEEGSQWYEAYMGGAEQKGIVLKDEFKDVDRPLSRGEATVMIDRLLGKDIMTNTLKFSDEFSMDTDQKRSIYDVVNQGIMKGYPDGTFRPNNSITRAEACAIISNLGRMETLTVSEDIPESQWTDEEYEAFWNEKVLVSDNSWLNIPDTYEFIHWDHAGFSLDENGDVRYDDIGPDVHHYDFENYEESKWVKPLANDLLKELLYYAKERGHYVDLECRNDLGGDFIQIRYLAHPNDMINGRSIFRIDLYKENETKDLFRKPYDMTIYIGNLAQSRTVHHDYMEDDDYTKKLKYEDYTFVEYLEPLRFTFVKIFGEEEGMKFYNYALNEYKIKHRDETMSTYRQNDYFFKIEGCEIQQHDSRDDVSKTFLDTSYSLDYHK